MSVSNAYKEIVAERQTPEFADYMTALFIYQDEAKRWRAIRNTDMEISENPLEQLQYYKAKARFSKASKVYIEAKKKYETFRIMRRTKNLSIKEIGKMLDIKIPKSLDDIIREGRSVTNIVTMTPEQEETIKAEAIKNMQRNDTTKSQFLRMTEREKDDPTLNDDAPLPEFINKKDEDNNS